MALSFLRSKPARSGSDPGPLPPRQLQPDHVLYAPLPSKVQTRILILEPGTGDDPLKGYLEVHKPFSTTYEAVSYAWGPESSQHVISLSTMSSDLRWHDIRIRENLATCLRHLRDSEKPRRLWVDALCISQTDLNEKAIQVANIGRIFREADSVLAWVGMPERHTSVLFCRSTPLEGLIKRLSRKGGSEEHAIFLGKLVHEIEIRDYWTRKWMVQELILGQAVKIICGHLSMDFVDFVRAGERYICNYAKFQEKGQNRSSIFLPHDNIWFISRLRDDYQQYGRILRMESTLYLCRMFNCCLCSERRDHVYALLQISTIRQEISPDYSIAEEVLFCDVLAADIPSLVENYKSLVERNFLSDLVQHLAVGLGVATRGRDVGYRRTLVEALRGQAPLDTHISTGYLSNRYEEPLKTFLVELLCLKNVWTRESDQVNGITPEQWLAHVSAYRSVMIDGKRHYIELPREQQ